jgi:hypothetical protein
MAGAPLGANGAVGDVDGDGYADIGISLGATFEVHRGGPAGLDPAPWGSAPGIVGTRVASAGDLDGDGFGDFTVGDSYGSGGGVSSVGRLDVFRGGTSFDPQPMWLRRRSAIPMREASDHAVCPIDAADHGRRGTSSHGSAAGSPPQQ